MHRAVVGERTEPAHQQALTLADAAGRFAYGFPADIFLAAPAALEAPPPDDIFYSFVKLEPVDFINQHTLANSSTSPPSGLG